MKLATALILASAAVLYSSVVKAQTPSKGICSWYGAEGEIPQGWPTACGTKFDRYALATAHPDVPKLPCGTKLRVKNLSNGKTVDVTVDDKGPGPGMGRVLDLTWAAFGKIENWDKGITNCSYTFLK